MFQSHKGSSRDRLSLWNLALFEPTGMAVSLRRQGMVQDFILGS